MRFTSEEEDLFKRIGVTTTVMPGHFIYLSGDRADRVFYILKGRVRVFENISSGREMTLDVIEAGHIFGESAFVEERERPACVQAVNQVTLVSCRIADLLPHFKKEPLLALHLLQMCSDAMDRLTNRMREQCLLDRYGKVASFILDVTASDSEEKGTAGGILPYTHEDLADSLGLSRSTVSLVLKSFEEKGWLLPGYRQIRILDREALQKFIEMKKRE